MFFGSDQADAIGKESHDSIELVGLGTQPPPKTLRIDSSDTQLLDAGFDKRGGVINERWIGTGGQLAVPSQQSFKK